LKPLSGQIADSNSLGEQSLPHNETHKDHVEDITPRLMRWGGVGMQVSDDLQQGDVSVSSSADQCSMLFVYLWVIIVG